MTGKFSHKAWVVSVDMGYGHQRAAYPLKYLAEGGIISANNYPGIPDSDRSVWKNSRKFYEFVSRFKKVPIIGEKLFDIFDNLQSIPNFYPRRDLSRPNIQVKQIYRLMEKNNWGKHLIDKLSKNPLPLVTPFFATAFMAEYFNYKGEIFCLATDTDISRAWVALDPKKTRIKYFAPNSRVMERLKLYGVPEDQIFLTGFPLPDENVGNNLKILKQDLGKRLIHLDPEKVYISQYKNTLINHLGRANLKMQSSRPLTITFAVGGAGAQRELGAVIVQSLKKEISEGKININLIAGTHLSVNQYFKQVAKETGLSNKIDNGVYVIFDKSKMEYFKKFNLALRNTDILWTKPSELSFYSGLGLPIIMAPPIGSQEFFNQRWLISIGAGIRQLNPKYTNEWLNDWLKSGWLAEAAMQGFLEAPKFGTYNIGKIIFHEFDKTKKVDTVLQY